MFTLFALIAATGCLAAGAARPDEAPPSAVDTRLDKALAVDVRCAPLADVLERASGAAGVPLAATGPAGDQRVTLHAARTTAGELQSVLRDWLGLRVSRSGEGAAERYSFSEDPSRTAKAHAWRLHQADSFVQELLRTAGAVTAGRAAETARALRERLHREQPELPDAAVAAVNAGYVRQSLLIQPLSPLLRGQLARVGWISLPLDWFPPADQLLLDAFAQQRVGQAAAGNSLELPGETAARVQYRLLYGDRWTDLMLLAQVGSPGAWSSAMLPSILFRRQDGSSLYPQAAEHPDDPDVRRRLPPRFETAGKDWDTVLRDLATAMGIKLAADSYARPWLFNPDRPLPEIAGVSLRDALDRLCRQHGYFWWKQDGWYMLRSRTWVEESRVAVPDRLLRAWVASVRDNGVLTEPDLFQLATLTDEQLLTLNLESRTPGDLTFLAGGFEPDEAALMTNGLLLFRSLPPAQRELALSDDLPALWLPPAQQNLFAAVAAQYGAPLLPENAEAWSFRVRQNFGGRRNEGARRIQGEVSVEWRFGAGAAARASVSLSDRALHQTVEPAIPPEAR